MMSDRLFSIPAEKAAKLQAHSNKSPVYVYYFCYTGEKLESFTVHFAKQDQDDGKCPHLLLSCVAKYMFLGMLFKVILFHDGNTSNNICLQQCLS